MRAGLFSAMLVATHVAGDDAPRAQTFSGTGQPFLPVPGCKRVDRVFVSGIELPAYVTQRFPTDADAKEHVQSDWPLWDLGEDATGQPVLLRSVQSNDGIWQEGAQIVVVGEWEEAEDAAPARQRRAKEPVTA